MYRKVPDRRKLCGLRITAMTCLLAACLTASCNADSIPGYIYASSTLYEPGYDNSAWCAQDHDPATAWMEGAQGRGYGESLYFETNPYAVITGGSIIPGFYKNETLFYENNAPSILYIHTGNQEAYLDVTEYAGSYSEGFEGYHFVFDEPLVSDGSVTITIVGVRPGNKYDDTCISELHFEGYQASADTAPVFTQDTPHVSLVMPAEDRDGSAGTDTYDIEDIFANPDGIGGDGREPDELPAEETDYLNSEIMWKLTGFLDTLYKLHCGQGNAAQLTLSADKLYSYSHAYMLNWYQSEIDDPRIIRSGNSHYASREDLKKILCEMFPTETPEEDLLALCNYFGAEPAGDTIRMKAEGNGEDNAAFYLEAPLSMGDMMGRTMLMGNVLVYDPARRYYVSEWVYYAYFKQDPNETGVFQFDELFVG